MQPRSDTAERRRLALARAAAAKILADPDHLDIGREALPRLMGSARSTGAHALLDERGRLIAEGPEAVAAALCEDSDHGRDLRQQSPFAGVLSGSERWAVLDDVYSRARG